MDPNACYEELVLAIRRGDTLDARQYATDLQRWLDGGGFWPAVATEAAVKAHLAQVLDPYGDKRDGVK